MPELPEVETVRRLIEPLLKGRWVVSLTINQPQVIAHPTPQAFAASVTGAVVDGMSRRGKFLYIHFEGGGRLALHLRMTGQLLLTPSDFPAIKHTHLIFQLEDQSQLRFADARRFGRLWYLGPDEADTFTGAQKLGPEPLGNDFSMELLRARISGCRRPIKECLLDQSVVAGIGNIYADEILFEARLRPTRPASSLTGAEWTALAAAIPYVLKRAIDEKQMTYEDYLDGLGRDYRSEPLLRAYGRQGQSCPRCGCAMERVVLAGRGSCFCPQCQGEAR